jgi:hypothetical protein
MAKGMNDDDKNDSLDPLESIANNSAAPAGDDSFSAVETANNDQGLAQQIEIMSEGSLAISDPANLTSVGDSGADPPDWPDF